MFSFGPISVAAPASDDREPVPRVPAIENKRSFYFEDSQVVLQASYTITTFPPTVLTISLCTGGWTDVQNPSLLPNSGVPIFQ